MKINEASIEINKKNSRIFSVSVAMPIWDKIGIDNFISVNIPLFGIKTFAVNDEDAEIAVNESIKSFCINAEKFGNGLENELRKIGWNFVEQNINQTIMSYTVPNCNSILNQIMQTGEQFVQKFHLEQTC